MSSRRRPLDPLACVRALAQDAADCGDENCRDHDPPIAIAAALADALDREIAYAKRAEAARDNAREQLEACTELLITLDAEITRLRRVEEAVEERHGPRCGCCGGLWNDSHLDYWRDYIDAAISLAGSARRSLTRRHPRRPRRKEANDG